MKKFIILPLLFLIFTGCQMNWMADDEIGNQKNNGKTVDENGDELGANESNQNDEGIIAQLFAEKFSLDVNDIKLDNLVKDDHHMAGTVMIGDEPGGAGGFIASDEKGAWEIVWDGNGLIDCGRITDYDFSGEMVPSCYREDGMILARSDELLKRLLVEKFLQEPGWESYSADDIEVSINEKDELHAKGTVTILDGGPGNSGGYLAANTLLGWVLVWHGNGMYACDDLIPYDFPSTMAEGCYESGK